MDEPTRSPSRPYNGARAVIATMHGKQRAIAPVLGARLGLFVTAPTNFDTDQFGTFTGEVPRAGTMQEAAAAKATLAMQMTGCKIGLGSEGAFSYMPLQLVRGVEVLVLVDGERDLVITQTMVTLNTNFTATCVKTADELAAFLRRVAFPSHAVIVRPHLGEPGIAVVKGIVDRKQLAPAIAIAASASRDGYASVEADMRAHMNPTRMASLKSVARMLANRVLTPCPACASPGFGQVAEEPGLPCLVCSEPTVSTRAEVWNCPACSYRENRSPRDGRRSENPRYCQNCNP